MGTTGCAVLIFQSYEYVTYIGETYKHVIWLSTMPRETSSGSAHPEPKQVLANRGSRLPRAERREQLIDVARGVFATRGFDATALEDVAEKAGISRPILYSHFGDKQGLFEAVIDREIANVEAVITESLAEPGEPRELVERGIRAFFTYVRDHPDGHAVLIRDAPLHVSGVGLGVMLDGLAKNITSVIEAGARALDIDASPAPVFAHALIGVGAHVGRWWSEHPEISLDDVTALTTGFLWNGLGGIIEQG